MMVDGHIASFGCMSHNFKPKKKKKIFIGISSEEDHVRIYHYLMMCVCVCVCHWGRACSIPGREMRIAHRILICL